MSSPYIVTASVPDGVTENQPTIAAEITSICSQGGTIWFPPGIYKCTNLAVPSGITLRGSHATSGSPVTRLVSSASWAGPLSIKGVSGNHVQNVTIEDLSLYGGVGPPLAHIVDTAYTSYLRFNRCSIENANGPGINLVENWDSRISDCDFYFCGHQSGTYGAITCNPGTSDFTNSLIVENCRFESFFGSAIVANGNTNKIFLRNLKIESSQTLLPYINLNGCVHVGLDNVQMTGPASGNMASMLNVVNCCGVFGRVSFERFAGTTVTNYVNLTGSDCTDLKLMVMPGSPEPSAGNIVHWDGLNPATVSLCCQSRLISPVC